MTEEISLRFEALAEPTRRDILAMLADGELSATEISNRISRVGRTAVSSHLRILRTAGLVNDRREGRYRWYSVNPLAAADVVDFLATGYRSTLSDLKLATAEQPIEHNANHQSSHVS